MKQNKECEHKYKTPCTARCSERGITCSGFFCIDCGSSIEVPHPLTELLNNKEKMLEIGRKATEDQREILTPQEEKGCEHDSGIFGKKHCGICQNTPQKKDTSWDVELKEKWTKWCRDKESFDLDYYSEEMLNWWEQEIQKTKEQTISSVIEEIEGMKIKSYEEIRCTGLTRDGWCCSKHRDITQALEDLKTLLKQKIN